MMANVFFPLEAYTKGLKINYIGGLIALLSINKCIGSYYIG